MTVVESMLSRFWSRYAKIDGVHVPYPSRTVPWMLHGDEGRGQCKRPLLVVSFQPVIGWSGEEYLNSTKCFGKLFLETLTLLFELFLFSDWWRKIFFGGVHLVCEAHVYHTPPLHCSALTELCR